MSLTVLIIVIAALVLILIGLFNSLVRSRIHVKEAWSDIEVQLKRRYNLIPNLVGTVKGYAGHEKSVLESVISARAKALGAKGVEEHAAAENMLTGALKSLFALSEAYPQLRASENFQKLQDELTDTEDKIQAARRFYNSTVMHINTKVEQFPTNIIARLFVFHKEKFFELDTAAAAEVPSVKF